MRMLGICVLIGGLLIVLAGCGGSNGITQTGQTERFNVQLKIDGAGFGERTALVEVTDREGRPATIDQVVLAPVMRDMGMASPEVTAQPAGPGRYEAKGEFFSMLGQWEIDVRLSAQGTEDIATFKLDVQG